MDSRVKPSHDKLVCRDFFEKFDDPCRAAATSFVYWPEHAFNGDQAMSMNVLSEPISIRSLLLTSLVSVCAVLTTVPPTSIVGAIVWTSYLGNALVTHLPIV